jgi:hypothetical protein
VDFEFAAELLNALNHANFPALAVINNNTNIASAEARSPISS